MKHSTGKPPHYFPDTLHHEYTDISLLLITRNLPNLSNVQTNNPYKHGINITDFIDTSAGNVLYTNDFPDFHSTVIGGTPGQLDILFFQNVFHEHTFHHLVLSGMLPQDKQCIPQLMTIDHPDNITLSNRIRRGERRVTNRGPDPKISKSTISLNFRYRGCQLFFPLSPSALFS